MTKVAIIALRYPDDIRVFKEVKAIKEANNIHVFLTDTWKTSPKIEMYNTIAVHRFPYTSFENNLIQYPFSLVRYMRIVKAAITESPAICHAHNFSLLFAGILVKLFTGSNLIYDAHEDYASMKFPHNKFLTHVLRKIELLLVKLFVDRVITVNKSLQSYFSPSGKTHVLMNLPLQSIQHAGNVKAPVPDFSGCVLGYIGHIIWGRGYDILVQVCKELVRSNINVKALIVGNGPFKKMFEHMIEKENLQKYFVLTGEVDHKKIPAYLKKIDVGLVLFQPVRYNNIIATPNKLFEYMAFGIPIIASDLPEIRKIMKETKSGLLVDPTNIQEITDSIKYLLENPEIAKEMGKNGKKSFETRYNWDTESRELVTIYQELAE